MNIATEWKWKMTLRLSENGGKWGSRLRLETLLKRIIRQMPFLCFVRYIHPRNKASPPNLAVSGLLSYLNYVSERPSCLCCEANITSKLSAILCFFFSSIPNLFRSTFKIALDLKFFTFYFPGAPGSGRCWHLSSKWLTLFSKLRFRASVLAASVAKPTLHRSSVQFSLGLFSPE